MTVRPLHTADVTPAPLRVVGSPRVRRPQMGLWVVYTTIAIVAFFGLILSRTALDETAFELRELSQQIAVEMELQQQLGLEAARLASPGAIVPAAEALGMVLPADVIPVAVPGVLIRRDTGPTNGLAASAVDLSASR